MGQVAGTGEDSGACVLDAHSARTAMAAAGARTDLGEALREAAAVLRGRFQAGHASYFVDNGEHPVHIAADDSLGMDAEWLREWMSAPDRQLRVSVALNADPIAYDLRIVRRTPSQDAALARGVRSIMHLPLCDERGNILGIVSVASARANAFTGEHLDELRELVALSAGFVQRALLTDQIARERDLLAREAAILGLVANAADGEDPCRLVVDVIREAIQADIVLLLARPLATDTLVPVSAPAGSFDGEVWPGLSAVLGAPENALLLGAVDGSCYVNNDLRAHSPSPVEAWLRDTLAARTLMVASGRVEEGRYFAISAIRRDDRPWEQSATAFLARIGRVLELCIERQRTRASARQNSDRLAAQARLLVALDPTRPIDEIARTFAGEIQARYDVECLAIFQWAHERDSPILYRAPRLDASLEDEPFPPASAFALMRTGRPEYLHLKSEPAGGPERLLYRNGVRQLVRIPLKVAGKTSGFVSVTWDGGATASERVPELEHAVRPLALVIERAGLLSDVERQGRMLAATADILGSIATADDTDEACTIIARRIQAFFDADHVALGTINFEAGTRTVLGFSSRVMARTDLPTVLGAGDPEAYARTIANEGEVFDDLQGLELNVGTEMARAAGLRSLIRASFELSGGELGLVSVGSRRPSRFRQEDARRLMDFARPVGLAIDRMRLIADMAATSELLGAQTRVLASLGPGATIDGAGDVFVHEARKLLGATHAAVVMFRRSRSRVAALSSDHVTEAALREFILAAHAPSQSMRLLNGEPILTPDTAVSDGGDFDEFYLAAGVRTLMRAPIFGRAGVVTGLITIGSAVPHAWTSRELAVLCELSAALGLVVERAELLATAERQQARTRAVLDILAALGPRDTIEEVAQPIAEALRTMYDAEHCAVTILDGESDNDRVVLVGIDSSLARWQSGSRLPFPSLFETVIRDGFHVDGDLHDDTHFDGPVTAFLGERGMRSALRVRIGTREDPHGFVAVGASAPGRFSEADALQLQQIVQPLSVVASYFRDKREAERRTERLEYTNRILTRLSAGGTAEHLAAGFLAECRLLFGCPHGVAMEFDTSQGMGRMLASDSDLIRYEPGLTMPIQGLQAAHLLTQPTPQLVADGRVIAVTSPLQQGLLDAGLFSTIRAPLIVQENVRGVVALSTFGPNGFTAEDAELLANLTRPLGIALEKASALASLGESELKYRSLVAQAEEMIFQFDIATLRILDANAYTSRALGYAAGALLALRLDEVIDLSREEIATHLATTLQDGELHLVDRHFRCHDGALIDVDLVASLVSYGGRQAVLVLARDVSERRALQRQLVQGQKMESLGTMAGHVAHDFNNLLTTILGFAGLLKRSANMDPEERENLGLIEDAARRAADLTGHLLSFARGGLVRFGPVDLRNVISDTMRLAEPSLPSTLDASTRLPATPVIVEGDSGQLQQALFNIVSNARDAMPDGGAINVELRTDGVTASVTIADTGPGMDDETRTRIFEPFYTTKPVGTGTGLGMAITYGIIQGHHGDITLESRPGQGTTFTITLPLLPGGTHTPSVDAWNAGEGNLILVVDDDEMVRRTTSATLAQLGYNVVEAPGGATAVEIVRARPERFSVVLLDLVMPGMTGSETFRALTTIRPDLPVVVCTGYAADAHIDTDVKRRIAGLVQKPFSGERLARALLAAGAVPTRRSL